MNAFLQEAYKYSAYTENGAVSHNSTGSVLLDYFSGSGMGAWHGLYELASAQLQSLWEESPVMTLQLIFYNRMITRKIKGTAATETVQRGQGNRSDFRLALRWLAENHPETFRKNVWLVPEVGCWKDLWHRETLEYMPAETIYELIEARLEDQYHRELLAKYLPRIRSKANIRIAHHQSLNRFAHGLIKQLGWTPAQYRKFKSSGKAHEFQRQMCRNEWEQIDFNQVPGKALSLLVQPDAQGMTTIEAHDQEDRFVAWIEQQNVAKFAGYPHQLMTSLKAGFPGRSRRGWGQSFSSLHTLTLNKQFDGLLAKARENVQPVKKNIWVAIDTSGSMTFRLPDGSTALDVAMSLGIYFSALNEGAFQDHIIMFDEESSKLNLKGTFVEKAVQLIQASTAWGTTNFQSVVDEIVRIRREHPEIPLEDYPETLMVITDLQFDPAGDNSESNYVAAQKKLAEVGLPKMQFIWWNVAGRAEDRPNEQDDESVMMLSGFDGAILAYLLDKELDEQDLPDGGAGQDFQDESEMATITPYAAMLTALNQEILTKVRV